MDSLFKALILANIYSHDWDDNGKCKDCGLQVPECMLPLIRAKNESGRVIQRTTFINEVELGPEDELRLAPPILNEDGSLKEGEYYAEVRKAGDRIYEVKRIGQG